VAPDKQKTFIVQTAGFAVKVFGTKFNVSSYSHSSVVLVEGSVSLSSTAGSDELVLSPNEQAVLSDMGIFDKKTVDVKRYTSWKDGYLTFYDTPIQEALKQIERYYNLSFNFGNNVSFDGLTCTGKIILSENLDNVMTTLSLISSTVYKKEGKTIYIYKKSL
jgi:ferric-dicitrate binding protein FerR (iron transport regulator)